MQPVPSATTADASRPANQPENAVLLHACCGPCSIMPVSFLRDQGLEPVLYFFNPNIHPFTEHERRREALLAVAERLGVAVILPKPPQAPADSPDRACDPAHPGPWLQAVASLGPAMGLLARRCPLCYELRLSASARAARALGFRRFTTTLLYSRYQNRQALLDTGARHAGPDLSFLPEDFRPGLLEGVRLSKEWGIYRQQYCGCMLSEYERYNSQATGDKEAKRRAAKAAKQAKAQKPQK